MQRKIFFSAYWLVVGLYMTTTEPVLNKHAGREPQSLSSTSSLEMMAMGGGY